MRVFQDGKEVKDVKIIYSTTGRASKVYREADNTYLALSAFELREDEPVKKTTNVKKTETKKK